MRVLYFTEGDSPHDQRFLGALAKTTHQVFALRQQACQPATPTGITEVRWPQDQPDCSGWAGWQEGIAQFRAIVDDLQPDLVHAGPLQGPALVTALSGFHPLVAMSWGSDLLRKAKRSPWMRQATQCVLDRTDVFVGDCHTVADEAAALGFPRNRMALFPWGVDLAHFSPDRAQVKGAALRQSLGWEDAFVVLCNRTWSPLYGVVTLAEAFVNTSAENPRLRLILAGDGEQQDIIQTLLKPVQDRVYYAGKLGLAELPTAYGAADLYVSPSFSDGSSISLLEALACGRPVLVSDIPGNREWVTPGQTGEVFQPRDPITLADKILQLAASQNLAAYGKRARQLAEQRADWQQNFQSLLRAYQLAVGQVA